MDTWKPNWPKLADRIINSSLQVSPGERVVFWADPDCYPELLEELRLALSAAGGVDHAAWLAYTPKLRAIRGVRANSLDPEESLRLDRSLLDLLNTADIFIWLPETNYFLEPAFPARRSEWVLGRWRGRSIHFHWFTDLRTGDKDAPINVALAQTYERAILELDYAAVTARQIRLRDAIRGKELHVTSPDGTDVKVRLNPNGWYRLDDGDAGAKKNSKSVCARDRETELPCGGVRTVPLITSVEGTIAVRHGMVRGLNALKLDVGTLREPLRLRVTGGHITELHADAESEAGWRRQTGDFDRVSEMVFGTNPLLRMVEGAAIPPYWGFGEGCLRFHLGDNTESSGDCESSLSAELFLLDSTVTAEGTPIIENGRLLV
jgi:hypothetical protein